MSGHEYRSTATRRAPSPSCARRGLVLQQARDGIRERLLVTGREGNACLFRHDLPVPVDVRCDHRGRAGKGSRQHHAEAFPTERWCNKGLRPQQLGREVFLGQEAEDVDALVGDSLPRKKQTHGERVRAGDPKARTRPGTNLRPGPQQHVQPFALLLPPGEQDLLLASVRVRLGRDEDTVRKDLVLAGKPAVRGVARVR